jgi:hypothetical protein
MNRQIQDDPIYSQGMDGIKKGIKETNETLWCIGRMLFIIIAILIF